VAHAAPAPLTDIIAVQRDALLRLRSERARQLSALEPDSGQLEAGYVEAAIHRSTLSALSDIDDALARISAGTYGSCAVCGAAISPARLEFRPMAANCADCQSRTERG
jgi:DnaK suppressor protein